jgi:sec-independent protein translocase protein TatB
LFGIGSWEFMIIAVLALLLFGPDKLPDFARTIGRFMRDFRRYQSMMESTIRAEVFTADPKLQKDPFKKGKEFGEKVGSGGFTRPGPTEAKKESASDETPAAEGAASSDGTPAAQSPDPPSGSTSSAEDDEAATTAPDVKPEASDDGEEGAEKA